jgi:exopolysaccharide biosynthesis WecB/TagA/CpsF family protein
VDGWAINVSDTTDAVDRIVAAAKAGAGFSVVTLNMDHLVKLRSNAQFRRAYNSAKFITADGYPVLRLAGRKHKRFERVTGADLIVPLVKASAREKLPVYLFGATAGVLEKAGAELASLNQTLNIVGTCAPSTNFDPTGSEAVAVIDRITESGARICFVALGAPKQEIFAAHAIERGATVGFICIGAGLDFIAGTQVRAPRAMRALGMEWLWRLASNPRRLGGRYVRCGLLLAQIKLVEPLRRVVQKSE